MSAEPPIAVADLVEIHRPITELLAALQRERLADGDAGRATAQGEAIAANDALTRATGMHDLYRRRMLAAGLGLPDGASVDAADFERFVDACLKEPPEGENRLRLVMARFAQDGPTLSMTTRPIKDVSSNQPRAERLQRIEQQETADA